MIGVGIKIKLVRVPGIPAWNPWNLIADANFFRNSKISAKERSGRQPRSRTYHTKSGKHTIMLGRIKFDFLTKQSIILLGKCLVGGELLWAF